MDNVRNVVSCPLSGLGAGELIDTRELATRLQQAIVGSKRFSNLPRKFNLSITGCREDCAHAQTHDLSFVPAARDNAIGFNVLVGGALGGMHPEYARPLDAFVYPADVVPLALAILEVYRDHGLREKRKESRLKWLLNSWEMERFRENVQAQVGRPIEYAGKSLTQRHGGGHIGTTPQRDPSLHTVGCLVPVGRITGDDLIQFAHMAHQYGSSELRLTVQQNILLPHVPAQHLSPLQDEPLLQVYSPAPSPYLPAMVTCTGNDYCTLAQIDSTGETLKLAAALDQNYQLTAGTEPIRIQISACHHACAQHHAAELGLLGGRKRIDDDIVDVVDIFIGGRLDENRLIGELSTLAVTMDALSDAIADQIRKQRGENSLIPRPSLSD